MTEQACAGSCNYHWRKADEAYQQALADYDPLDPAQSRPDPPDLKPVLGNPWCARCQAVIRRELAELDDLASMLGAAADGHRGRRPGAKLPPAGKEHGGPSPSPTADLLSELYGVLCEMERLSLGPARTRRGFLAAARSQAIARLLDQFDTVIITTSPRIAQPAGREAPFAVWFGETARRWHTRLKHLTKAGTGTVFKPVRCPRCDEYALWWTEGDDYVVCHGKGNTCGRLIGMDEFDQLAAEQEEARARLAGEPPTRPAA